MIMRNHPRPVADIRVPYSDMRIHTCPHCEAVWAEFADADEYPDYCPHCGKEIRGSLTGGPHTKMSSPPNAKPEHTLWCRAGVTLSLTTAEITSILGSAEDDDNSAIIRTVLSEGRFHFDGDSYVPEPVVREYNEEHSTSFEEGDIEFTL